MTRLEIAVQLVCRIPSFTLDSDKVTEESKWQIAAAFRVADYMLAENGHATRPPMLNEVWCVCTHPNWSHNVAGNRKTNCFSPECGCKKFKERK